MGVWIIEPRDPVVVRDGRPFDPVPGARAVSLEFPFPSTTTGAVRTSVGTDMEGRFRREETARVKQIAVRGPLLVELDSRRGEIHRWFAPAPADAAVFDVGESVHVAVKPLVPLKLPDGARTDLPDGLFPVGLRRREPSKPSGRAPRYWNWEFLERWLLEPVPSEAHPGAIGIPGPVRESRTHVGIRQDTRTADEDRGALFQTQGLEFECAPGGCTLSHVRRLALAVSAESDELKTGVGYLGGERRLVFWRPSSRGLPDVPESLRERVMGSRACRVILLTPAYLRAGWRPSWLLEERLGVKPVLVAAALRRYQVVSGWDLAADRPKPSRRLVPSGTVYFLKLEGSGENIRQWVTELWMRCVSDDEEARLDGFGLAVVGAWDGTLHDMEV